MSLRHHSYFRNITNTNKTKSLGIITKSFKNTYVFMHMVGLPSFQNAPSVTQVIERNCSKNVWQRGGLIDSTKKGLWLLIKDGKLKWTRGAGCYYCRAIGCRCWSCWAKGGLLPSSLLLFLGGLVKKWACQCWT